MTHLTVLPSVPAPPTETPLLSKELIDTIPLNATFKNWGDLSNQLGWVGGSTGGTKRARMKVVEANWEVSRAGHSITLGKRKAGKGLEERVVEGVVVPTRKIKKDNRYLKNVCHVLLLELEGRIPEGKGEKEICDVYLTSLEMAGMVGLVNDNYKDRFEDRNYKTRHGICLEFFNRESYNKLNNVLKSTINHLKSRLALKIVDTYWVELVRVNGAKPVKREATSDEIATIIHIKRRVLDSYGVKTEGYVVTLPYASKYYGKVEALFKEELGILSARRVKKFSYSREVKYSIASYKQEIDREGAKFANNKQVIADLKEKIGPFLDSRAFTRATGGASIEEQRKEWTEVVETLLGEYVNLREVG